MCWPYNGQNTLGMPYVSTAPVSQLLAHTFRQGKQFTVQNYPTTPVQSHVLQDLARELCSAAVSGQEVEAASACLQQPAWCWWRVGCARTCWCCHLVGQHQHNPVMPLCPSSHAFYSSLALIYIPINRLGTIREP